MFGSFILINQQRLQPSNPCVHRNGLGLINCQEGRSYFFQTFQKNGLTWFWFNFVSEHRFYYFSTIIEGLTPISITLTVFNFLLSNRLSMLHFMAVLETGQGWLCIVTNE